MRLLHDYILIRQLTEEKTSSGIILTIEAQSKQLKGIIKHVGSDIEDASIVEGVTVIFDKLNSSEIEIEGEKYIICQYDDIICIL